MNADIASASTSARPLTQQPSEQETVYLVEYKNSGEEFLERLTNQPTLSQCHQRLQHILRDYPIDPKVKVYMPEDLVRNALEELRSNGLELHGAKGDVTKTQHVYLRNLHARRVLATVEYKRLVDAELSRIPKRLQISEMRRSHVHVSRHEASDVVDLEDFEPASTDLDPDEEDQEGAEASYPTAENSTHAGGSDCHGSSNALDSYYRGEDLVVSRGFLHLKRPTSEALQSVASTTQMRDRCKDSMQPRKKHKSASHDKQQQARAIEILVESQPQTLSTQETGCSFPYQVLMSWRYKVAATLHPYLMEKKRVYENCAPASVALSSIASNMATKA